MTIFRKDTARRRYIQPSATLGRRCGAGPDLRCRAEEQHEAVEIQRKLGAAGSWSTIVSDFGNPTSYSDTALTPGTTYYYRVRGLEDTFGGWSLYSNEDSATTDQGYSVSFSVDMRPAIYWGVFDPSNDTVALRGSIAPLSWGNDQSLTDGDNDTVYTTSVLFASGGALEYKYVIWRGGNLNWERDATGKRTHQVLLGDTSLPIVSYDDLPLPLPAPPYSDSPDGNTKLLMHFEEAGTPVIDASGNGYNGRGRD